MARYELNVDLQHGEKFKNFHIIAEIGESKAFAYGNRKYLAFSGDLKEVYDIRYDPRYSEDNEIGYIEEFLRTELWTGNNGSWKIAELKINRI